MRDADEVEKILVMAESILGIAKNTNILVLNEAIKAARAGVVERICYCCRRG